MSKITIEKSDIMTEGFYKVILDTNDKWDKQRREWDAFKKEVDAQLATLYKTKEASG